MADLASYMPLQQSGQEEYQVFPESKTRFFHKKADVQNSSVPDQYGKTNETLPK